MNKIRKIYKDPLILFYQNLA